jgi:hypothetical protein
MSLLAAARRRTRTAGGSSYIIDWDFAAQGTTPPGSSTGGSLTYDSSGLILDSGDSVVLPGFTARDGLHAYLTIKPSTTGTNAVCNWFRNASAVETGGQRFRSGGFIRAVNGTTPNNSGAEFTAGVFRHLWIDWYKGTGANGVTTIFSSPNATKPGSHAVTVTGNSITDAIDWILAPGITTTFGRVVLSDTVIDSNP